jgi:hypothetical protein
MNTSIETRPKAALGSLLLTLAAGLSSTAAELRVPADYPTIQAAVNAAQTNDIVRLAPGVYAEQVTVLRKHLALLGSPGAVVRAKTDMVQTLASYDFCRTPLLGVALSEVTIKGISFEGEHLGNAYPCSLAAIIYSGSSGAIEECSFSGFRGENDFSGAGVVAANNTTLGAGPVSVQVLRCAFRDNAFSIFVRGADAAPDQPRLKFVIEGNTITGVGPTTIGAETGILVSYGATGTVRGNTITDHAFIGGQGARGIFGADWQWIWFGKPSPAPLSPVSYTGNVFRNNQQHLVTLFDQGSQIVGNTFAATGPGPRPTGVAVSGRNLLIATNRFSDMPTGVLLLGDDPDYPNGAIGIASDSAVLNNRFCNVTNPIVVEPLATNITQQGTLTCPFARPSLAIAPAALLAWPGDEEGWAVESAVNVDGPWTASDATPFKQYGRNSIAVPTEGEGRFFRLR